MTVGRRLLFSVPHAGPSAIDPKTQAIEKEEPTTFLIRVEKEMVPGPSCSWGGVGSVLFLPLMFLSRDQIRVKVKSTWGPHGGMG